jgi:hypothetical protein
MPYQVAWDTTRAVNGIHVLQARAYDAAGNVGDSTSLAVTVNNIPLPQRSTSEIVLYAAHATTVVGAWQAVPDTTAAGGVRLWNPDASAAKVRAALAAPANYFELSFRAEAGRPYRLWVRSRAQNDYWGNDSAYVQFSGSVTRTGIPAYRIGSTSGATVNLEDCSGCGLLGWGWQDNGYGVGVLGPLVYFEKSGVQTIRVQPREDGISIDQIVLSPEKYLISGPGTLKKDVTIVGESTGL